MAGPGDGESDPHLEAALRSLPAADREVVELWAWEGLEPREIAVVIDSTANAVSVRLHRIRRRLADDLAARKSTEGAGHNELDHATTEEER